jgi:hypothetical protein
MYNNNFQTSPYSIIIDNGMFTDRKGQLNNQSAHKIAASGSWMPVPKAIEA